MEAEVQTLADEGVARVAAVEDLAALRDLETDLLGKKSKLTSLKAAMGSLDPDERKTLGAALHGARTRLEAAVQQRRGELDAQLRRVQLESERLDLTEYLGRATIGHAHPITQTWERLEDVFVGMGYRVADGPEVETDWFNFEAL
ncbi:MAG: phenylalanine--tRNA ligase subunit alpha, partial [Actinomycetes bacterium]